MMKDNDSPDVLKMNPPTNSPARSLSLALHILSLAVAYFLTGKLGTFLAIPPGYATAIWPPSGIALAGILLYGYRVWPGILLGSFLVNLLTSLDASSDTEMLGSVIITLAISAGACLQAVVGAYLVRRYAGFPNSLTGEKEVFSFMLFGGIFSTLVNSTIAVAILVATAHIPAANFLSNWGTWWMGDALGVFIFTPLIWAWMSKSTEFWQKRRIAITLPIITMFVLSSTAVFYESQNENKRLTLEFNQQATALNTALASSLSTHLNELRSLESFYASSTIVNREEFRSFVSSALDHFPGIQALEWAPLLLFSERKAFEVGLRSEGYPNAQVTERDDAKHIVRAGNRPNYVPVKFVEPYLGNEIALGYDLHSVDSRREALDKARDSGEISLTSRIDLVQEKGRQHGVLAFFPVYRNGFPHQTLEQRRNTISGYIVGVFRGEDIITAALKGLNNEKLPFQLIDQSAPPSEQLIFSSEQRELKPKDAHAQGLFENYFPTSCRFILPVGDRTWQFEVVPTQAFFATHHSANAWLILLSGLILTSIVSVFTLVSSGRSSVLQQLVDKRTAELSQSEARFRLTFNAAPIGVTNSSPDGRLLEVNQGYCEFLGYSHDELLEMSYKQVTAPEYHQLDAEMIRKTVAGEISEFNHEKQYIRKNGQRVWGHLRIKLVRDAHGLPDYFVAVIENIDRRKQVEQALAMENEKNLTLLHNASDGIHILDYDGNVIEASDSFCAMLGYQRDEIIGMNVVRWEAEHSATETIPLVRQQFDQSLRCQFESRHRRKDGSLFDVEISGQALELNGKPVLFNSSRDISVRKRIENERDQLLKIIEDAPDFVATTDMQTHLKYLNTAGARLIGLADDADLTELEISDIHPEWASKLILEEGLPEVFAHGFWRGETALLHRDGREIPVAQLLLLHRDVSGNPQLLSTTMRDITIYKKTEQMLREAKEAAELLAKTKSEFLSNMSHEIRTPMNAIIGLSQLALNKTLSSEIRDYLEKIYSSSNSLLGILNDILDFSKMEAGRFVIELHLFDLDTLLTNINNLFEDVAKQKGLILNLVIANDVPRNLVGDRLRLQQILSNLLGNAIKFTKKGSVTLNISVSQIAQSQVRLLFSVTDTGIGMSEIDREQLFQPFTQADSSITRRFGGTGLGLAISHNLLQLMDGKFSLTSTPGLGSCFSFELILGMSSDLPKSELHELTGSDKINDGTVVGTVVGTLFGARVLVAEDNLINQQIVREFLKLSGISVEIANNGKEALDFLEKQVFDAVLMDVHMPVLDGFEATQQIRSQARWIDLPIIALTAGVTEEERDRCHASGMNDFIAKPINPKKLLATLAYWIKQVVLEPEIELTSRIQELPGFDLNNLLEMLGNNQALATRLLFDFRSNMKNTPDKIAVLIAKGDFISAGDLLHKLKGASGNIGATQLYEAAKTLETELKAELLPVMFDTFRETFNQTMSVIASLPQPEEPPLNDGNVDALKHCAEELDLLLKGNDFISEDLLDTIKPHLGLWQLDLFIHLRKQIKNLNYNLARQILRQLTALPDDIQES